MSTACTKRSWCVLQVGHEGECSYTFRDCANLLPWDWEEEENRPVCGDVDGVCERCDAAVMRYARAVYGGLSQSQLEVMNPNPPTAEQEAEWQRLKS